MHSYYTVQGAHRPWKVLEIRAEPWIVLIMNVVSLKIAFWKYLESWKCSDLFCQNCLKICLIVGHFYEALPSCFIVSSKLKEKSKCSSLKWRQMHSAEVNRVQNSFPVDSMLEKVGNSV